MFKNIFIILTALIAVGLCTFSIINRSTKPAIETTSIPDYKNTTYTIEGAQVKLVDGKAETTQVDSSIKTVTEYFGDQSEGDLNGDGLADASFILSQNTGGSGTFYYVVGALKKGAGYIGTNAILLGDRISPQTTEIKNGEVIVNYADRKPGEPMITTPSVGVSKYLKVNGLKLAEVK